MWFLIQVIFHSENEAIPLKFIVVCSCNVVLVVEWSAGCDAGCSAAPIVVAVFWCSTLTSIGWGLCTGEWLFDHGGGLFGGNFWPFCRSSSIVCSFIGIRCGPLYFEFPLKIKQYYLNYYRKRRLAFFFFKNAILCFLSLNSKEIDELNVKEGVPQVYLMRNSF